jgi:hypothetical protein
MNENMQQGTSFDLKLLLTITDCCCVRLPPQHRSRRRHQRGVAPGRLGSQHPAKEPEVPGQVNSGFQLPIRSVSLTAGCLIYNLLAPKKIHPNQVSVRWSKNTPPLS